MSSNGLPFSEDRKEWNEFEQRKAWKSELTHLQKSKELNCNGKTYVPNPCKETDHHWVPYYDGDIICKKCGWTLCI